MTNNMETTNNNIPSPKMREFLDEVNALCLKYGYEFYPTIDGWTGELDENGEYKTFACIGNGERVKIVYIDGDA